MRRSQCGLDEDVVSGWRRLRLSSGAIEVSVLPDKGADIYQIVDLATGIDPLFKSPWGLAPPGAAPRQGSAGAAFLENYQGSWQELFPNTNDACDYLGTPVPFHGEVATRPWSWSIEAAGDDQVAVRFSIDCRAVPLRLERLTRLRAGERRLVLEERVTNLSGDAAQFVWGHHCVLGAPLVAAGAVLRAPCRTVVTPSRMWEDSARLVPAQHTAWPTAELRGGGEADLSLVPGPEASSHDDVYFTDLRDGWAEVSNDGLRMAFRLAWDPGLFRWIISWQPYGGASAMPLRGAYGLGIEPWTTGGNLAEAIASGDAIQIAGHAQLTTTLAASIRTW
jgi:hypothetical protein